MGTSTSSNTAMKNNQERSWAIIKLLNAEMCADCRFRQVTVVRGETSGLSQMTKCTRRDCDNWIMNGEREPVLELDVQGA